MQFRLIDYYDNYQIEDNEFGSVWECNGVAQTDEVIELSAEPSNAEIIGTLREMDLLSLQATEETVLVEWYDENWIELTDAQTGEPLYRLVEERSKL